MPSAFAHAAVGASLAGLLPRESHRLWTALILGGLAAAPDLDVVGFSLGIPYHHPLGHRGLSHSLAFAAVVGLLSLPLWRWLFPAQARLGVLLTGLAVASHGVLDAFTDGGLGIGLFVPFDNTRYFAPWRPILTSPLSVSSFFSSRGIAVLSNELVWVGLPCLIFAGLVRVLRPGAGRSPDAA